jgi:hypothetical protein
LERSHQLSAAGKTLDRLGKVKGDLSASQKRQLLAAASTKKKLENENEAADIFVATEKYRGQSINTLRNDLDDVLTSGNSAKAKVLLGAMTELHGAKSTAGYLGDFYADKGRNLDTQGLQTSIGAVKEHVTSNPGIMKELKEDNKDILSMVVSGGVNGNGVPQGLSYFTEEEARKNKMEHWVTQSKEALQRAAASGVLNYDKAQEILKANNEPSSAFYNRLSDKNKAYLDGIKPSSAPGSASSSTAGAPRTSTPVSTTPSGIILGGSVDAARRAGGYNDSNAGRRNMNSKNMKG